MKKSDGRHNTPTKGKSVPCTDHTGQAFPSMKAMCEHWGLFYTTYKTRMKHGWTQEEALIGQRKEPAEEKKERQ